MQSPDEISHPHYVAQLLAQMSLPRTTELLASVPSGAVVRLHDGREGVVVRHRSHLARIETVPNRSTESLIEDSDVHDSDSVEVLLNPVEAGHIALFLSRRTDTLLARPTDDMTPIPVPPSLRDTLDLIERLTTDVARLGQMALLREKADIVVLPHRFMAGTAPYFGGLRNGDVVSHIDDHLIGLIEKVASEGYVDLSNKAAWQVGHVRAVVAHISVVGEFNHNELTNHYTVDCQIERPDHPPRIVTVDLGQGDRVGRGEVRPPLTVAYARHRCFEDYL